MLTGAGLIPWWHGGTNMAPDPVQLLGVIVDLKLSIVIEVRMYRLSYIYDNLYNLSAVVSF